jgi:hypothetical protein
MAMESGKDTCTAEQFGRLRENGWLTEYQLRRNAKLAGYETTHAQLVRVHQWGLLGPTQCGLWPTEAVDRLIRTRKLESEGARFLPRRVIRLRGEGLDHFPVPNEILRRAMVELVPVIKKPAHSLHLVHQAMCWLLELRYAEYGPPRFTQFGTHQDFLNEQRYPPAFSPSAQLPAPPRWRDILQDPSVPDDTLNGLSFGRVAWDSYRWNLALEGEMKRQTTAYLQIPFEERIVLLTVRHLALAKQQEDGEVKSRQERVNQLRERLAAL